MKKDLELFVFLLDISALFQFSQQYTAALKAYFEIFGDAGSGNVFIDVSQETFWRQLMSEISKIYDAEQTFKKHNCSMKNLQRLCRESPVLTDNKKAEISTLIDNLQLRYESLLSKK